jgi:hypothetical protein
MLGLWVAFILILFLYCIARLKTLKTVNRSPKSD